MGNEDGITQALQDQGNNKVVKFKGGYFSFAFGNEIAFCLKEFAGDYFILNCDEGLFNEVKKLVDKNTSVKELKKFWCEKYKDYSVSNWSADFDKLRKK